MTAAAAAAYDAVAYPSLPFPHTLPDRLAMVARLHGLAVPDLVTARVLELGGGSNVITMAAAWPYAHFTNIDISPTAITRGTAMAQGAGLDNVTLRVGDIVELAETASGEFDYIIVHGVYAWVPETVRAALLRLIGRVLAPEGVAFISYNAFPGCHLRVMLRDMLRFEFDHIADPKERVTAARAWLTKVGEANPGDRLVAAAMRSVARPMATKSLAILHHDELGDIYAPQYVSEIATAAAREGLAYLNDASALQFASGFPGAAVAEAEVVAAAQRHDFHSLTFFHESLFVRPRRTPRRGVDFAALTSLWIAGRAKREAFDRFVCDGESFNLDDPVLGDALERLHALWPQRVAISDVTTDPERLEALYTLATTVEAVTFHAGPCPGVRTPGSHPTASRLARWQVAQGRLRIHTLDHRVLEFAEPGPRAFLALLDGSRDRTTLEAAWAVSPHGGDVPFAAALAQFASAALLIA